MFGPGAASGKSHGRRRLVGCSPWGREESDTTEQLPFHFSRSCIGERNGSPLQCSCLENPRDGGAWWASVYGVTQSRTRLKQLSTSEGSEGSHCLALLELEVKCQDCPAPAQVGGVEHTLGGSKTSLDTTLRASAPAPWDPPIPLIGW